jgi:hypothetical protein
LAVEEMVRLGQGAVDKEVSDRHRLLLVGHPLRHLQHLGLFLLVEVVVVLEHLLMEGQAGVAEVEVLLAGLLEQETLHPQVRLKAQTVGLEVLPAQPLLEAVVVGQLPLVGPDQARQAVRVAQERQIVLPGLV